MNLTTRMMIKGIFLTNYRVQASWLYTADSVHVRLVAEHVHVDIKYIYWLACVSGKDVERPWPSGAKRWVIL